MFIEKITVRGYRSIHDQTVVLGRLNYFVGRNNAGKTNLISALRFLLEGSKLTEDDFYREGDQQAANVYVSATIADVEEAIGQLNTTNQTKLRPLVRNGKLVIQKIATKTELKPSIQVQKSDDVTDWGTPTGIDAAIKALFPTVIPIETFKDPSEDLGTKSTSTLQKLIKTASESVASHIGDLQRALGDIDRKLNIQDEGDSRAEEIVRIEQHVNEKLEDFLAGRKIRLQFDLPEVSEFTAKASIKLGTDDRGWFDTSQQGQGFQRLMVFGLLTVLSERVAQDQNPMLILFEEPESFLHPNLQRQLAKALEVLSERHQILAVTHSPVFVHDTASLERVHRTCSSGQGSVYHCCRDHDFGQLRENKLLHAFSLQNTAEYLFADEIVVVEGVSDQTILGAVFQECPPVGLPAVERAIVEVNGKDAVKDWVMAFRSLGLPTRAVVDLDFIWKGAGQVLAGNPQFQGLFARFKAAMIEASFWNQDAASVRKEGKIAALDWLVQNGGQDFDNVRSELRNTHYIWVLKDGEIEDQIEPRYAKGRFPALPAAIESGDAEISDELKRAVSWLGGLPIDEGVVA